MPLREMRRAETELASGDAVIDEETATFQMLEIPTEGGGKLKVAYIVLKAAPDVIDVQRIPACGPRPNARRASLPRERQRGRARAIHSV